MSTTLSKNDLVELTIEDYGNEGEGVAKHDGFPLFINGALICYGRVEFAEMHLLNTLILYTCKVICCIVHQRKDGSCIDAEHCYTER